MKKKKQRERERERERLPFVCEKTMYKNLRYLNKLKS